MEDREGKREREREREREKGREKRVARRESRSKIAILCSRRRSTFSDKREETTTRTRTLPKMRPRLLSAGYPRE
jgi:hypothetical protein